MPELPEVETICRALRNGAENAPGVIGWQVQEAAVLWARTIASPGMDEFRDRIRGQTISDIGRRGKFIIISLSEEHLLVHLRMSGDLLIEDSDAPVLPHHRLLWFFTNGKRMAFNDPRKFGRVWLVKSPEVIIKKLGPEPFDVNLNSEVFYNRLQAAHRRIKPLLLDQEFLAGLGNIYTDEALHLAQLHPLIPSNRISREQADRLLKAIRSVLEEGIQRNGTSIDWVYRGGEFQNYLRVYNRDGLPCFVCGAIVQRIRVGQRGTHICPKCQKLPNG